MTRYLSDLISMAHESEGVPLTIHAGKKVDLSGWAVLLIGNTGDWALTATMAFERHGALVHRAHDGPAALRMLSLVRATLILLDLQLPTLDGWVSLSAMRSDPGLSRIPRVAVIEPLDDDYHDHLHASGFDGHVFRPLDETSLLKSLRLQLPQLFS